MKQIGPYLVREELARGGMGVVYRAHDPRVDREVALKLLHGYEEQDSEELERFQREAEATAQIRHPGVVAVHDFGWEHGKPYLVMDLVQGESLKRRLRLGPLPEVEATRLMEKIARALEAAHKVGVLHRDIKPENILVRGDTGEPVVADFGLAKVAGRQSLTASGTALGTPAYMAPEQALAYSEDIGEPTDVYGLGATLYELLTGRPPFDGSTAIALMAQVIEEQPRPPCSLRPDLDPGLEAIVLRCLAKDPAQRFPSAAALADALARHLRGEAPALAQPSRRSLALPVVGILVCLGLSAAFLNGLPEPDAGDSAPGEGPAPISSSIDHRPSGRGPEPEPRPEDPIRLADYGWRRFERGEFLAAQRAFQDVLAQNPASTRALLGLARVWREWGDNLAGLDVLRGAPHADPDPEVLELRAALLREEFQHKLALEVCERLISLDVERPEGYVARAEVYSHMGRRSDALREIDEVLALDSARKARPLRAQILATKALFVVHDSSAEQAHAVAAEALELDPDCDRARFAHALASFNLKKHDMALADLDYVLSKEPQNANFYVLRGICLQAMGRLDEALAEYAEACRLWPGYPVALMRRSQILCQLARNSEDPAAKERNLAGAEQAALDGIESCERFAPGYIQLAETRSVRGDAPGRLAALKHGAAALPNNPHIQMVYANALVAEVKPHIPAVLELRKTDPPAAEAREKELEPLVFAAERAALKAIEFSPRRQDAYDLRATLKVLQEDPAGELRVWQEAVENAPGDVRMWGLLGGLLERRRRWAEAAECYRRAAKLAPKESRFPKKQGLALSRAREFEEAVPVLNRAVELGSEDYSCWLSLGKALVQIERYDEAIEHLELTKQIFEEKKEEVSYFLGDAYWGLGRHNSAAARYKVYLETGKVNSRVKRARERIAEARRTRAGREQRRGQ